MWSGDCWLSPDSDRYIFEGAESVPENYDGLKFRYHTLLNEFRTPKDKVVELLALLQPVNNGHSLMRIGGASDGGYLVPDDLDGVSICFSPGVQHISDFEIDLATKYGIKSSLIDGSIDRPVVPADISTMISFTKGWIGAYNTGAYTTDIPTYSLNSWITEHIRDTHGDVLLQIDIEDAEWEALLALDLNLQRRMRIIVCEFGNLQYMTHLREFVWINRIFQKILLTHDVVHIHPNNCCGKFEYYDGLQIPGLAEVTFHRKDRAKLKQPLHKHQFTHPLDQDCVPSNPPLIVAPWLFTSN